LEAHPFVLGTNLQNTPLRAQQAEESVKGHKHGKKVKCVKARNQSIALRLGDDIQWGEAMDAANMVLVGRVRGRNYSTAKLRQWTAKIWGHYLTELPFVQTFVRDWFTLRFSRAEHTTLVLSSFWHIEQTPMLLKRWNPLFDPEREQLGCGSDYQVCLYTYGLRIFLGALGTPWEPI